MTCDLLGGFPGGSDGEESACNAGDLGSIPGLGRSPGGGHWLPTAVFLSGESHGLRSLAGYSPWGHKKSDTTERFSLRSLFSSGFCPHSSVMLILFAQLLAISLDDGGCCCCC